MKSPHAVTTLYRFPQNIRGIFYILDNYINQINRQKNDQCKFQVERNFLCS